MYQETPPAPYVARARACTIVSLSLPLARAVCFARGNFIARRRFSVMLSFAVSHLRETLSARWDTHRVGDYERDRVWLNARGRFPRFRPAAARYVFHERCAGRGSRMGGKISRRTHRMSLRATRDACTRARGRPRMCACTSFQAHPGTPPVGGGV